MSGFHIPDRAITYPFQSRWYESDTVILGMSAGGKNGVIAVDTGGCEVTESTIPAGTTHVAAGQVVVDGELIDIAAQTVGHDVADALLDRLDLVVAYNDGTCIALAGTSDAAPLPPLPDTDSVALAQVTIPAGDTAITDEQIVDKRVPVPSPLASSAWIGVSAPTDLARTSTTTIAVDPVLQLPVTNGATYRIKLQAWFSNPSAGQTGVKWALSGPNATRMTGYYGTMYPGTGTLQHVNVPVAVTLSSIQQQSGFPAVSTEMLVELFLFYLASASGTLAFGWSQIQVNTNALTRRKGSLLEYQIV